MPVKSADKSKGALRKKTKASVNKRQAGLALDCQKLSERLEELEIRYQVALENSKQLLYDLDLTTGRIV